MQSLQNSTAHMGASKQPFEDLTNNFKRCDTMRLLTCSGIASLQMVPKHALFSCRVGQQIQGSAMKGHLLGLRQTGIPASAMAAFKKQVRAAQKNPLLCLGNRLRSDWLLRKTFQPTQIQHQGMKMIFIWTCLQTKSHSSTSSPRKTGASQKRFQR